MYSDAALRQLEQVSTHGTYVPAALPIFNIPTNPVEYLDTRLPMPTVSSPAYTTMGENIIRMLPHEQSLCCTQDIPSKELRQVRENLGAGMADRGRWGRGAGAGVAASLTEAPMSGTQQVQHGPVSVSGPAYTNELYDQGFISMSAVPVVHAGKYKDPITGVEYDAYESAMPPPDADHEESVNAPARNVKLAHLQGGWRDTTPRPTKREVLEDDFNMQYDRTINTYGTYDMSRQTERFERNNRFSRDNEHPDPDGPVLVGIPANQDGNQGNVKVRHVPYQPPTNRGKWAETTFRDGIDPNCAVANSEQMVAQTFTTFPCERHENTRQDGGGIQPTANYEGFTDLQMGEGRRDIMNTQRSASEGRYRYHGPAGTSVDAEQLQDMHVEAPTGYTGLDLVDDPRGAHGGTAHGQQLQDMQVEAPTGYTGLDLVGDPRGAHGGTAHGQQLQDMQVSAPTGLAGTKMQGFAQFTAINSQSEGTGTGHSHDVRLRTEQQAVQNKLTGLNPINFAEYGGVQDQNAQAQRLEYRIVPQQTSKGGLDIHDETGAGSYGGSAHGQKLQNQRVDTQNSKSGITMYDENYGSYGGSAQGQQLQNQRVENLTSKSGVTMYDENYGSYGGSAAQGQKLQNQRVENLTSKSGVTMYDENYGSYGGSAAQGQKLQNQRVENLNSKSGVTMYDENYGSYGGSAQGQKLQNQRVENLTSKSGVTIYDENYGSHGATAHGTQIKSQFYNTRAKNKLEMLQGLYTAFDSSTGGYTGQSLQSTVTNFNTKKGSDYQIRIPNGSETSAHGAQNWAMSTNLNSKRENQYNPSAINVRPDDSVRYLGHYNHRNDNDSLNSRQFGNFVHAVTPAGAVNFMQQLQTCSL